MRSTENSNRPATFRNTVYFIRCGVPLSKNIIYNIAYRRRDDMAGSSVMMSCTTMLARDAIVSVVPLLVK